MFVFLDIFYKTKRKNVFPIAKSIVCTLIVPVFYHFTNINMWKENYPKPHFSSNIFAKLESLKLVLNETTQLYIMP